MACKRLTRVEQNQWRELRKRKQPKCPLCQNKFTKARDPVVDHCHDTGLIRSLLCRNCNGREGEIKNRAIRCSSKAEYVRWLSNLVAYLQYHEANPGKLIYPSHKTEDEKRIARNKKARDKRAKTKRAKK